MSQNKCFYCAKTVYFAERSEHDGKLYHQAAKEETVHAFDGPSRGYPAANPGAKHAPGASASAEWAQKTGKEPAGIPTDGKVDWATTHHNDNKVAPPTRGAWNAQYE